MDSETHSKTKIENDNLVSNLHKVRKGWSESFQEMAANGDDELLMARQGEIGSPSIIAMLIDDTIPTEYDEK